MAPRNKESRAFGESVRAYRHRAGFSQEELASKTKIHRTYIGGIERGERNPTLTMIHRLARALHIPAPRLLEGAPEAAPEEDG